ncbi:antigen 5 like allergen Cul n 1-like [Drosophila eugracilis]|uniref:antigen 5 like allergen Cul n 1-like n=1 Tax=Drosophila eugracilis TaxID=29029 RepID=UPI001BD9C5B8|nr:antigen 5 like allergen Cul n 1-like [Drosophila eugracilis]
MWSCLCIAAGLLLFSSLSMVNMAPETDFCLLKNCPADKKLPHIGCNNKGNWSSHCGKDPKIISIPKFIKFFIVNYHNTYRDLVAGSQFHRLPNAGRMLKMTWDPNLAYLAELLVKQCDLKPSEHCWSTEKYSSPGYHAVYNKFNGNEDTFRVVRSQLNSWYDQYKHVTAPSLIDGLSGNGKEIGHFLRMMVGPSNRLGCAMAEVEKDGMTQKWLSCLYSCSPQKNTLLYEYSSKPGMLCSTGVDSRFQHLCNSKEPVENCKHSELFKPVLSNDTASLIRGMMNNKGARTFCSGHCPVCCKLWGMVKEKVKDVWGKIGGGGGGGGGRGGPPGGGGGDYEGEE